MWTMSNGSVPDTDSGLLSWATNFSARITAAATLYGLTAMQASTYATLLEMYAGMLLVARDPITRTRGAIAAKNAAKKDLLISSRQSISIIEGQPTLSDEQRLNLGIRVPKTPTPIPAPTAAPNLDIVSVKGRTVALRLHGEDPSRRGNPAGVAGANLYSFVGPTPPDAIADWTFQGGVTRTTAQLTFSTALEPGTTVWLTACWTNPRDQTGPTATPTSVTFGAANVSSGNLLKIAA
jgi:hypothetical protein